jgi:hypothetical protein
MNKPMGSSGFRFCAGRYFRFSLVLLMGATCASAAKRPSILTRSRQLVIVTTADWDSLSGTLQRFERRGSGGHWTKVGESVAVVVGKSGMGWGDGVVAFPEHAATDLPPRQSADRSCEGNTIDAVGFEADCNDVVGLSVHWQIVDRPDPLSGG